MVEFTEEWLGGMLTYFFSDDKYWMDRFRQVWCIDNLVHPRISAVRRRSLRLELDIELHPNGRHEILKVTLKSGDAFSVDISGAQF
jgi:hypothetical protein